MPTTFEVLENSERMLREIRTLNGRLREKIKAGFRLRFVTMRSAGETLGPVQVTLYWLLHNSGSYMTYEAIRKAMEDDYGLDLSQQNLSSKYYLGKTSLLRRVYGVRNKRGRRYGFYILPDHPMPQPQPHGIDVVLNR